MRGHTAKFILALLLLPGTAAVSGATAVESQLSALEQTWLEAAQHRDLDTLKKVLGDDFVDVSYKGALRDKAAVLAAPAVPTTTTQRLSDLIIRVYGDMAVITGRNVVTADDHSYTATVRFTDIFVKRGGGWQAVSSQETLEQAH